MSVCLPVSKAAAAVAAPVREFCEVVGNSENTKALKDIFNSVLVPLYGDQTSALQKIHQAQDREAFLLREDQRPVGVLVYKKQPTNEFAQYGVHKSLEVKSLFVVDPAVHSGKGIATMLLDRVTAAARRAQAAAIHVTVSEEKTESLAFFKKKGFSVVASMPDRYKKGSTEHLLVQILASSSSSSAAKPATVHNFEFQRIQGDGRKARLEKVQELIDEKFAAIHGTKAREQKQLEKEGVRDGRLLVDGDVAVGALTYQNKLHSRYRAHGLDHNFEIESMLVKDLSGSQERDQVLRELFEKAKEKAEDLRAKSMTVLLKTDEENGYADFLKERGFTLVPAAGNSTQKLFVYHIKHKTSEAVAPVAAAAISQSRVQYTARNAPGHNSAQSTKRGPGSEANPWSSTLKLQYVRAIASGQKTIEGRIASGMFNRYKAGDFVKFFCNQQEVLCEIVDVKKYKSFKEMLEKESYKACLPEARSREQAIEVYDNIPGYKARAEQNGALAIHIKVKGR